MEKYTLEHKGDNNACGDELDFNLWWDFKNNNSCIVSLQIAMKEAHAKSDEMTELRAQRNHGIKFTIAILLACSVVTYTVNSIGLIVITFGG